MKQLVFLSLFICIFSDLRSQDSLYARYLVNRLASEEFMGRGYVEEGCRKAAIFIQDQFDSLGLKSFGENHLQPFSFPVNTFPSRMKVSVDGVDLVPGKDFIVYPFSAGANKKYTLKKLDVYHSADQFNKDASTCHFIFQDSIPEDQRSRLFGDLLSGKIKKGALVLLQAKKLTWSVAKDNYEIPVLQVLSSSLPAKSKKLALDITGNLIPDYTVQNVIGFVKGKLHPDSFLVFSAHYDHLGKMGDRTFFPGANDNASGVAMMLCLAKYYTLHQPDYSVAFIAFAGEEAGLVGSKYYTENPLFPLSQIKFMVNMDLLGTGEEGMMVVNATEFPGPFRLLDSLNTSHRYLVKIGQRGKAKNSDHYWFTEKGVPAFFFYTMGGIQAYHDIYDRPETLRLTEFNDVFRLAVRFMDAISMLDK